MGDWRLFEYPRKWCTYYWLLYGWCHVKLLLSLRTLCVNHTTIYSHCIWSHTYVGRLTHARLAEWPRYCTWYCGNTGGGTNSEIRVSTESWLWRKQFSRRSCRESILWPFDHESGALPPRYLRCPSFGQVKTRTRWLKRWNFMITMLLLFSVRVMLV